ncbi:MAG: hypothetical protein U9Q06_01550 [Nanoarchaeota archaeon]|nr:hypothetical protein [Nanoarchaeota archaeon]
MEGFIKKIVDGKIDEKVHRQFMKFSRGEFPNRALVKVKKTKDKYSIVTSAEYTNELVKSVAEKLKDGEMVKVTGAIVSTRNLKEEPDFNKLLAHVEVKQFRGVKRFILDLEMSKEEILSVCEKFPRAFIALSFRAGETELKIKPKSPKASKKKKDETEPKADFCRLKTKDKDLVKGLIFEVAEFKEIEVNHTFLINEIEIPEDEDDPALMREKSIRKGKIIRKLKIDGQETVREIEFAV